MLRFGHSEIEILSLEIKSKKELKEWEEKRKGGRRRRESEEGGREGRKKGGRGRKEWRERMKNKNNILCGTNMNEWSILSRLFKCR